MIGASQSTDPARPQRIDPASRPRPTILNGPRVTLRRLTDGDVSALSRLLSSPGVAEWWPVESEESLRVDVLGDEETVSFAIELGEELVGVIMYSEELWRDYFSAGIDIALGSESRGQGLGPEAMRVLIGWLFDQGGHHRITIDPASANRRAIRAYEKVGFRRVGVMREYELGPDGVWRDGLLMDLLKSDLAESA